MKANKKEDKQQSYQGEDNKTDQVVSRATQMVELLSEENSALRKELENYYARMEQGEQVCFTSIYQWAKGTDNCIYA